MDGKIGLEEHFALHETLAHSKHFTPPEIWDDLSRRILDLADIRISEMDQYEMEMMIVSLNSPAIQAEWDRKNAIDLSIKANDYLSDQVDKYPDRFRAFCALPMQDPDAAIEEMRRCAKSSNFVGVLVNGFSQINVEDSAVYLDDKRYWPFWEAVQELDMPFYLHPRDPHFSWRHIYDGHPWLLMASWAFGVETATHALRLMCSGLFDRFPKLKIILGHLGEGLPYSIWRAEHRIKIDPRGIPAKRPIGDYLRENFHITTSGNFRTQSLIDAILELGVDRILFSTDYPFEAVSEASIWFDETSISENDRLKIGRTNAIRLFKLDLK